MMRGYHGKLYGPADQRGSIDSPNFIEELSRLHQGILSIEHHPHHMNCKPSEKQAARAYGGGD